MRTNELLRKYMGGNNEAPKSGWQRLVWHAADLLTMATELRNTRRARAVRNDKFVQEELFNK